MTKSRHSYIAFYPSDWLAGTARMTRLVKSVYHDICLYNWDKNEPVPEAELILMLADLAEQGDAIVNALVNTGRLHRNADGSVYSDRALAEADKAFGLWQRKSEGGKKGARSTNKTPGDNDSGEPEPEPEPDPKEEGESSPSSGEDEGKPARKTYDTLKIQAAWNEMAKANGLPRAEKMTDERRKKTRARLDDYEEAEILEAISLVPQRPFCMGQNDRRWKADFDWLIRPDTVTKLREGGAYTGGGKGSGWLE